MGWLLSASAEAARYQGKRQSRPITLDEVLVGVTFVLVLPLIASFAVGYWAKHSYVKKAGQEPERIGSSENAGCIFIGTLLPSMYAGVFVTAAINMKSIGPIVVLALVPLVLAWSISRQIAVAKNKVQEARELVEQQVV